MQSGDTEPGTCPGNQASVSFDEKLEGVRRRPTGVERADRAEGSCRKSLGGWEMGSH